MGSHEVGAHCVPATLILDVTLDTCHPGLPPGWHVHTHSGFESHRNQKWGVGAKALCTRKAPKDPISARLLYLSPPRNSPTQVASATPKSGHRTAGDIPLAKKDTLLSWILYWYVRLRSRWAVGCNGLLHRILS